MIDNMHRVYICVILDIDVLVEKLDWLADM